MRPFIVFVPKGRFVVSRVGALSIVLSIVASATIVRLLPIQPNVRVLAYIDPGVGAMVVQAVTAAFFGALFYFRNLRRAIARFFLRLVGRAPREESVVEKK